MLGLLFGTACLFGFFYVWRRPHGAGGFRFGRGGRRRMLSFVSRRLDATPAQEKVMRDAVQDLRSRADAVWAEASSARSALAEAFRSPDLDPEFVVAELRRVDGGLEELRRTLAGRVAELHAVLDQDQRQSLADLLGRDFRRSWRGPYRTAG